jgi:hypothetical protein
MKHFDKIFVISLPNEVGRQRMKVILPHLKEEGIDFLVWVGTERENGVVGLLNSMHGLLTHCIEKGFENTMILEDDNRFLIPAVPFLDEVWPQVPKDYHCLFLSCNLLSRPERVSQNILRIRSSYSTNAIVYSLEAMKLILPLIEANPTQAFDITLMKGLQQPYNKCFCTIPMLSEQRPGYSSIEKKEINWAEYQQQSFKMFTHNI